MVTVERLIKILGFYNPELLVLIQMEGFEDIKLSRIGTLDFKVEIVEEELSGYVALRGIPEE